MYVWLSLWLAVVCLWICCLLLEPSVSLSCSPGLSSCRCFEEVCYVWAAILYHLAHVALGWMEMCFVVSGGLSTMTQSSSASVTCRQGSQMHLHIILYGWTQTRCLSVCLSVRLCDCLSVHCLYFALPVVHIEFIYTIDHTDQLFESKVPQMIHLFMGVEVGHLLGEWVLEQSKDLCLGRKLAHLPLWQGKE